MVEEVINVCSFSYWLQFHLIHIVTNLEIGIYIVIRLIYGPTLVEDEEVDS